MSPACINPQQARAQRSPPTGVGAWGPRHNDSLSLPAPETQDQVLLSVSWRHRPAGHHPHHRHLYPKVMPLVVGAPTASVPPVPPSSTHQSFYPPTHPPPIQPRGGRAASLRARRGQGHPVPTFRDASVPAGPSPGLLHARAPVRPLWGGGKGEARALWPASGTLRDLGTEGKTEEVRLEPRTGQRCQKASQGG